MSSLSLTWCVAVTLAAFVLGCAPTEPVNTVDAKGETAPFGFGDGTTAVDGDGPDTTGVGPEISTGGGGDRFLLSGAIVTPGESFEGQVLVEGHTITCAEPGTMCSTKPGADGATVIETQGVIVPGLIDMHNHILFDIFNNDDWMPNKTYANHTEWPNEPKYAAMLDVKQCLENASQGKPDWCKPMPYATKEGNLKCELDKWGELKGLVAGTTSIVGLPGTSYACFGSLARSIGGAPNDLCEDKIQTSALFPPSQASADGVCKNYTSGTTEAYLIHCGEGVDGLALGEFSTLGTASTEDGCLFAPGTVITHGTAFGPAEFAKMAETGMKLTWSPASNVALYGQTTDIPAALDAGVLVSMGPDWSMGGSQNMLDELRFADAWDDAHWNNRLSPKDLVTMATHNGAASLGLGDRMGQIKAGFLADLFVVDGDPSMPYESVLAASPREVRLVMVAGVPLYGEASLKAAAPHTPGCEDIDVCGRAKFLCVAEASSADKLDQTLAQIKALLEQAMLAVDAATTEDGWNFAPLAPLVACGG